MNLENYEETRLPKARALRSICLVHTCRMPHTSLFAQDTWAKYLKEGMNVNLLTWNGKVSVWNSPMSVSCLTSPSSRR